MANGNKPAVAAARAGQKRESQRLRTATSLILNRFETWVAEQKGKGHDVTGLGLMPAVFRSRIEEIMRTDMGKGGADILKTLLEGAISTGIADQRIAHPLIKMVDVYFDAVRDRSLKAEDDDTATTEMARAADKAMDLKELEKYLASKAPKKSFAAIEKQLTPEQREEWLHMELWAKKHDPESAGKLNALRDQIDDADRMRHVLSIVAEPGDKDLVPLPDPLPPTVTTEADKEILITIRKRVAHLETTLPKPNVAQIIFSAVRGERTAHTAAIEKKVKDFDASMKQFEKKQVSAREEIEKRNKGLAIPFWLICVFVGIAFAALMVAITLS